MEPAVSNVRYAGFWKRLNAYGYDVIIVQLFALVPMFLFYSFPSLEQLMQLDPAVDAWFSAFTGWGLAISAAYNILFLAGPDQATPGKKFCGIRVMSESGGRVNLVQSALRHLASGISMLSFGLGFLIIPFTPEKTAIHDLLAHTRVVYKTKP